MRTFLFFCAVGAVGGLFGFFFGWYGTLFSIPLAVIAGFSYAEWEARR